MVYLLITVKDILAHFCIWYHTEIHIISKISEGTTTS